MKRFNFDFNEVSKRGNEFVYTNFQRVDAFASPLKIFLATALLFVCLGLGVAAFPKFFAFIFGVFLMAFGLLFGMLAWKAYCLKKKFDLFMEKANSMVVIQRQSVDDSGVEEEYFEKKFTLH